MAAHSYWRINVTTNDGDANFLAIAEVEMRATKGGADQCSGGTPSASTSGGSNPATLAFDNITGTHWATNGVTTGWIRYQFAAPVDVLQYVITAQQLGPTRAPRNFTLEYSDDGSSWTVTDTRTGQTGWVGLESRVFNVDGVTVARVSQLPVEVLRTNLAVKARTSQVVAEVLRINTGTVIRTSQIAVEVLRPNAAAAANARPVVIACT